MTRHVVTIIDSDDHHYKNMMIIELKEGDEYIFPDGRKFVVRHISNSGLDTYIYQGDKYWIKVRSSSIELF